MEKESNSEVSVVLDTKAGRFVFSDGFQLDRPGYELNILTLLISATCERMVKPNLEIFISSLPDCYSEKLTFEIAYEKFTKMSSRWGFSIPETEQLIRHSNKLKEECHTAYQNYFDEHSK